MNWNWSCDDLLWIRIRHRVITPKEEQSQVVLSECSTFYHVMEKLSVHITGKRGGIISHLCRQNRGIEVRNRAIGRIGTHQSWARDNSFATM